MTLSGVLDFAAGQVGGNAKGTSISTRDMTSATSVIRITAVEDLGGGMRATAHFGLDPRHLANDNNAQTEVMTRTFARDELFVGLQGGFGNLRLGSPNSIGLTSFLGGSVLGTGIGSGYASATNQMTHVYSQIRYDRSARYDSPNMNGFTVSALYAPGGDQASAPIFIPNARSVTELGLAYAKGPLSVSFANISQDAQTNAIQAATLFGTTGAKTSTNLLNASYKIGATTLVAGWNDGEAKIAAATPAKTKGSRVGVRHDIGAVALMAQYTAQKTGVVEANVMGLRADYALSKRTAAYVGYENYDNGAATNGTRKLASVGVRHSF